MHKPANASKSRPCADTTTNSERNEWIACPIRCIPNSLLCPTTRRHYNEFGKERMDRVPYSLYSQFAVVSPPKRSEAYA